MGGIGLVTPTLFEKAGWSVKCVASGLKMRVDNFKSFLTQGLRSSWNDKKTPMTYGSDLPYQWVSIVEWSGVEWTYPIPMSYFRYFRATWKCTDHPTLSCGLQMS